VELVAVVKGNHDRGLGSSALPVCAEAEVGGWRVVHGDGERPAGPVVQGHEHPCVRWSGRLSAPCYLVADDHLVLPAFSPDAAGANVLRSPRWRAHRCWVIAGERVLDFGEVAGLGFATKGGFCNNRY
jgi:metallophosphoesterase superfamily enzyme